MKPKPELKGQHKAFQDRVTPLHLEIENLRKLLQEKESALNIIKEEYRVFIEENYAKPGDTLQVDCDVIYNPNGAKPCKLKEIEIRVLPNGSLAARIIISKNGKKDFGWLTDYAHYDPNRKYELKKIIL